MSEEAAEQLRAIFAASLDAIVSADDQGRIRQWNPSAERIFGWIAEEVVGKRLSETIVPPAFQAQHEAGIQRLRDTGHAKVAGELLELPALRRDGTEILVELVITPIRIAGTLSFTAFLRDITARKATEAAMQRTNELLEDRLRERTAELQAVTERWAESERRLRLLAGDAGEAV
jgi:PAS domain S-box-containing protein